MLTAAVMPLVRPVQTEPFWLVVTIAEFTQQT